MKTIQIEKESIHNNIVGRDGKSRTNQRPYVAEFVLKKEGKDTKVKKEFLRATSVNYLGEKGGSDELDQRRYTWEAPQYAPLSIGSCVSYNEFETVDGMFIEGQWQEMSFFEIRKHLLDEAEQAKKNKKSNSKPEDTLADNPFGEAL